MRPLDGVTVVAFEHAIAAPFATRQPADLGARVKLFSSDLEFQAANAASMMVAMSLRAAESSRAPRLSR